MSESKGSPFTQMWKAAKEKEGKPLPSAPAIETNSLPLPSENQPEKIEIAGQLDSQSLDSQLPTLDSQPTGQPVTQNNIILDSQLPSEKKYPSRRLRRQKTCRLPVQKLEKWELWCFLNKIDFQDAVERALDLLTGQPVTHILIDDLEDIGTTDDVLIFYHKWTGNKITQKDKDARETVRKFDDGICKIGIAISIYRAKTKINSFRYCVGAIEEQVETPIENTQNYLKYLETAILGKKTKG
jgi:hypothetical protein